MRDTGRRRKRELGSTWSCDGSRDGVDGVSGTAAFGKRGVDRKGRLCVVIL